jgi:putative DNA primase/helicase
MNMAAEYIQNGLPLIPVLLGRKGPANWGWNEKANSIADPSRASELNGNIGIAHAYCLPTPTMALDLDDMELASAWFAARGVNVAELLDADDAVQIVSGRRGRGKLLYRLPLGVAPIESLTIKGEARVDE